jgi:hypothetical protein
MTSTRRSFASEVLDEQELTGRQVMQPSQLPSIELFSVERFKLFKQLNLL